MVWKITFTTLGDLPWMLLFLLRTCVTAYWKLRQCHRINASKTCLQVAWVSFVDVHGRNSVRNQYSCEGRIEKNPSRGSPFAITRLAEWWQTVIPRDGFFYPNLTRIMDSFSCSPLFLFIYYEISFQKSLNTLRCNFTWWRYLTSWVR